MADEISIPDSSFKATADFALETMRSLVLVNGGAAVGMLTFVGNVWARNPGLSRVVLTHLADAMASYGGGLALAVLACAFSYLAQWCATDLSREGGSNSPAQRWFRLWQRATMIVAILSWLAFLGGLSFCFIAFKAAAMGGTS
jgi:hypothetical protein